MGELTYLRNLDGLRAYAVLGVLAYHIAQGIFAYGWMGVQMFFMLSGFLITRILLNTKHSKNYFRTFYIRRTLRIFPIYYMCLLLTLIYTIVRDKPHTDVFYYVFYLQNYRLGLDNFYSFFPYFFNHTWSLGVEEQFYLFWPLIVRFTSAKKLVWMCIGGILLSIVSKYVLVSCTSLPIVWTNLVANLDMLCAGSLLAVILFAHSKAKLKYVTFSAFAILILYLVVSRITGFDNFLSATIRKVASVEGISLLVVALFLFFVLLKHLVLKEDLFTKIFFSNPVMVFIGKISYGIYLYHFIISHIIEGIFDTTKGVVVISLKIIVPIAVAAFSYHFIEKRILEFKDRFRYFEAKPVKNGDRAPST